MKKRQQMSNDSLIMNLSVFICVLVSLSIVCVPCFSLEQIDSIGTYPIRVGQFAEYKIVSLENNGTDNRYIIRVVKKERLEEVDHFLLRLDIYESGKRQISFSGLIKPSAFIDFSKDPEAFISKGLMFLFSNAKHLMLILEDNSAFEIDPNVFNERPKIFGDTFFEDIPDEKNEVDFSKLIISSTEKKITVPAGDYDCYHFQVKTFKNDAYTDEGFDLWRSRQVPFLGIVKAEFSKTEYAEKRKAWYLKFLDSRTWIGKIYANLFIRKVKSRDRSDVYTMTLLNCKK